ncbi:MAG: superoxide dismutase family protein [Cystobacterineae bacterium]|nr:superoxide dismutase family protein [Cystobacterineae bacterium]
MKKLFALVAVFALSGLFFACAKKVPEPAVVEAAPVAVQASAELKPTEGNLVQGNVSFTQEGNGIRVVAEISGLTPGPHGFHIHDIGDCSAPDAMSAGGHFNPHQTEHGKVGEETYHAGDLPSLEADTEGNARLDVVLESIVLAGEHSIVGRSLIVHADADDYVSQPTGNSGARVACAVIQ